MSRQWISANIGHGIRIGRSYGPEDRGSPKLPAWRRYELRQNLLWSGTATGIPQANYLIDKALADGTLDGNGDLAFTVKGGRAGCVAEVQAISAAWGMPLTEARAADVVDDAIGSRQWSWGYLIPVAMLVSPIVLIFSAWPPSLEGFLGAMFLAGLVAGLVIVHRIRRIRTFR